MRCSVGLRRFCAKAICAVSAKLTIAAKAGKRVKKALLGATTGCTPTYRTSVHRQYLSLRKRRKLLAVRRVQGKETAIRYTKRGPRDPRYDAMREGRMAIQPGVSGGFAIGT